MLRDLTSWLLDLIYPPVCVLCGEYSAGELLCPACRDNLEEVRSDGSQEVEIRRQHPELELLVTPFLYTGDIRALLLRLKTASDRRAVGFLAEELAQALVDSGIPEVVVTCMPMSREKLRRRGFNHAELLARAVAVRLGSRFDAKLLEHRGGLTDQHSLSKEQRGENARRVIRPGRSSPQGRVVLLVDDICTTGSSLAAAVAVLREQGARQVIAAAAAVTPED